MYGRALTLVLLAGIASAQSPRPRAHRIPDKASWTKETCEDRHSGVRASDEFALFCESVHAHPPLCSAEDHKRAAIEVDRARQEGKPFFWMSWDCSIHTGVYPQASK